MVSESWGINSKFKIDKYLVLASKFCKNDFCYLLAKNNTE